MSVLLTRKRIRLKIDASSIENALDQLTGKTPALWRGNDVQFELGGYFGADIADSSNWSSLLLEIHTSQTASGSPLMSKTVTNFHALTDAEWVAMSAAHATVAFTATETNLSLSGADHKDLWLVVSVITSDGFSITLGKTSLNLIEDNTGTAGTPPTNDPTYFTQDQVNALFIKKVRGTAAVTNGSDVVTVTGLALSTVPAQILLTLRKPASGGNLFATVRDASITTDGFIADLSGAADAVGYKLDYLLIP